MHHQWYYWPSVTWEGLHIGPLQTQTFFIIVAFHSKWPEVVAMKKITSEATICDLACNNPPREHKIYIFTNIFNCDISIPYP